MLFIFQLNTKISYSGMHALLICCQIPSCWPNQSFIRYACFLCVHIGRGLMKILIAQSTNYFTQATYILCNLSSPTRATESFWWNISCVYYVFSTPIPSEMELSGSLKHLRGLILFFPQVTIIPHESHRESLYTTLLLAMEEFNTTKGY